MLNINHFSRFLTLLVIALICGSWGFLVHRTVNQLAVYHLPTEMQSFFYQNEDRLVKESIEPDLRRNSDPTEGPKHFIDLEKFGDSAAWKMPMRWEEAIRMYSRDNLEKNGYLPYAVVMLKERLTHAFRAGNKDSILLYAGDLGHYIGDAHVPLHTTENYDGQLSNQKGIHNLWESAVPEVELDQYELYNAHHASYLADPAAAIWTAIRKAHELLIDVFEKEKEINKSFTDSTKYEVQIRNGKSSRSYSLSFAKAYGSSLGKSVNEQLLESANLIADFWYTSWVDAGKPKLESLLSAPFNKEGWQKEYQDYMHNRLIPDHLLLSRQGKP